MQIGSTQTRVSIQVDCVLNGYEGAALALKACGYVDSVDDEVIRRVMDRLPSMITKPYDVLLLDTGLQGME